MSQREPELATTAQNLRRAFDESFARPPATMPGDVHDFLAIRVAGGHYAIRVDDLIAMEGRRRITPLPSADSALLGIAAARGRLLPVFRLASLIGSATWEEPAWFAICGLDEPVGLAFAALEGHLRVRAGELYQAENSHAHVREAIRLPYGVRHVLDVPAILAAIRQRFGTTTLTSGR